MTRIPVFLLLFVIGTAFALGQTASVTNADLEKFRQKRIQAENEYRQNYARLGMPSPEELDRMDEQTRIENEALAARLREDRLERERIALEREAALSAALAAAAEQSILYAVNDDGLLIYSYYPYGNYSWRRGSYDIWRKHPRQTGYFAGGQFWPTPGGHNRFEFRRMLRRARRHR